MDLMLWIVVIATTITTTNCEGFMITAHLGMVTVGEGVDCKLTINDTITYSNSSNIPGLWFGLIEYECGEYQGYLLSNPSCAPCGIYCPQNDKIMRCQHILLPALIGSTIGIMISVIVLMSIRWTMPTFIRYVKNKIDNRKNRKHVKLQTKVSEIMSERKDLVNDSNKGSTSSLVMAGVMGLSLITESMACDQTLFINSVGKICDANSCQEISTYAFGLTTGSTICFNKPDSSKIIFSNMEIQILSRYQLVYKTSDFNITTDSISQCKRDGSSCWNGGSCSLGAKHPEFKIGEGIEGYDCNSDSIGCDYWCWHQTSCTWTKWKIVELGNKAHIYKLIGRIWNVVLMITSKSDVNKYTFNTNNPMNMLSLNELAAGSVPITVKSVLYEESEKSNYLINDSNEWSFIEASEPNMPEQNRIGDYQISIMDDSTAYNHDSVRCRASSCKSKCVSPEPRLRRYRRMHNKNIVHPIINPTMNFVTVTDKTQGTANLMIGNMALDNLFIEPSFCKLSIIATYGCTGCSKLPYVVIQAREIKSEGLIPFESNCTTDLRYLSCSQTATKLVMNSQYEYCYLYIRNTNQTLYFKIDYEFVGSLTPDNPLYSNPEDYSTVAKSVITNPNFINSIVYSFGAVTAVSAVSTIILRLSRFYIVNKKSNEESRNN